MYTIHISNDVLTIKHKNKDLEHIHFSTNYPNYSIPPQNIIMKNNVITQEIPSLLKYWNKGNFITCDNNTTISRLSQYNFDQLCYSNENYGKKYPDNKKLYAYVLNKYMKN